MYTLGELRSKAPMFDDCEDSGDCKDAPHEVLAFRFFAQALSTPASLAWSVGT